MAIKTGDHLRMVLDDVRRGASEAGELRASAREIAVDMGDIFQHELDLAKAELSEQASTAARASTWTAIAGAFAFFTVMFLLLGAMWGLAEVFDEIWMAALAVAGGVFLLTVLAGLIALARWKQFNIVPQRAIESSKETVNWASSQLRSNSG